MYQKLNVAELGQIQKEVLEYIENNIKIEVGAKSEYCRTIKIEDFPTLHNFLSPRLKLPLQYTNILFVPPESEFTPHLDGSGDLIQNVVITVPIKHYENTVTSWYDFKDVAEDDTYLKHCGNNMPPFFEYDISFFNDGVTKEPMEKTTVDKISLLRADWYHGVENLTDETRIVLVLRCGETSDKSLQFTDYMEFQDLI